MLQSALIGALVAAIVHATNWLYDQVHHPSIDQRLRRRAMRRKLRLSVKNTS